MAEPNTDRSCDDLFMIRLLRGEQRPGQRCPVELIDVATGTRRAFPSLQALVDHVGDRESPTPSTPGP
jgi:hypothetical protein